ncbi:MAG TPA: DUF1508 domain-containing protein [Sedimenticola sp.]|nr:DUF1508 domain-containing protein [Sedimenticola sp.]
MKVILKESDAQEPYSFSFVTDAGKAIVRSENYKAKKSALNGIESVKKNCQDDRRYEMKTAKNGKHFFNVKASNGQVVGTSMMFATEADRDAAIAELRKEGPGAAVEG